MAQSQDDAYGDYESRAPQSQLDDGMYDAIVKFNALHANADGSPKKTDDGKFQSNVTFAFPGHSRADGSDEELRRRFTIGFGQNSQTGAWAAWAQFIAAATGIPCGDARQKSVKPSQLNNRPVRVVVERVTKNGNEYVNVTKVLAPPRQQNGRGSQPTGVGDARPQPAQSAYEHSRDYVPAGHPDDEIDDGEIPF